MRNQLTKLVIKEGQEPQKSNSKRDNLYIKARAYFLMYKEKHLKLINTTIEKYRDQQDHERLVAALNFVLRPLNHSQILGLRASTLSIMKTFLSAAVDEEIRGIIREERIQYSKIHQQLTWLQSQSKQRLPKQSKINFEIISLLYQDILSLFLRQSQSYDQYCDSHQSPLYYNDDLTQLLCFFKIQEIKKLRAHFSKNKQFIKCEGMNQRIVQVIKLCTIIILRFRIFSTLSKIPYYSLLNTFSDELLMNEKQGLQALKKKQPSVYVYNLSQLSIFIRMIETTHLPFSWKNGLISLLKNVAKTQILQEKRWLLLKTKFKYNISLETLVLFLDYIEKNAEEKIHYMFKLAKNIKADYQIFSQALSFIFLRNDSYVDAFEKRGFNQKFKITHGTEGTVKCTSDIKGLILLQSASNCILYGLYQIQLLKMEKLSNKILAIKKYNFTYNEMMEKSQNKLQKDISITFILATIENQVIAYEIFFKTLSEAQFISSVQKLILESHIPYRFVILLHAYNDYTPFARLSLTSLLKLAKKIKTRVYISNLSQQFRENIFLFAYIYSQVAQVIDYPYQVFSQRFTSSIYLEIAKIKKWQARPKTYDKQCQTIQ